MADDIAFGVTAGPARDQADRDQLATKAAAAVWSAVWELSQFWPLDAIRDHVEETIREIDADAE